MRLSTPAQRGPYASHRRHVVLLVDANADRRVEVLALLEGCSADVTVINLPSDASLDPRAVYAFVGADERAVASSGLDATMRCLRAAELPVACYGDGAARWEISLRAQLLIWGVHRILDRSSGGFGAELGRLLRVELPTLLSTRRATASIDGAVSQLGIIAHSKPMRRALRLVEHLAHLSELPVLIVGDSGTGKEMVARALHQLDGRRRNGPMIAVNCGALPRSLAEAELFGHSRAAFSGAERQRPGLIRAANGGVLLLDEIGELELGLQTRLLRVLQEKRVRPVGEDHDVPIDIRVVAATHRDLTEMVQAGTFREDLYHRLSVVPIRVPPLRERKADIPPLLEAFAEKHASLRRLGPAALSAEFVEALALVELPGNVRQLENIVRRALAEVEHDQPLGLADLPEEIWRDLAGPKATPDEPVAFDRQQRAHGPEIDFNITRAVERCERAVLTAALIRANGSQTVAARLMGISYRCVYNKLRKYDITPPERN